MRVGILVLGLMLICGLAFAEVTAEIIQTDLDNNGNIRVWACHKINGVEVESNYPKINGHFVYCTRYSKQNFKDLTTAKAIEDYILNDIKNYDINLISKEFDKKAPKTIQQIQVDYNATANQTFMSTSLDKLVGKTISATEASYKIDTNNDGVLDKDIRIKDDGTKIISDYNTPPVTP